jgi:hypothetical protein
MRRPPQIPPVRFPSPDDSIRRSGPAGVSPRRRPRLPSGIPADHAGWGLAFLRPGRCLPPGSCGAGLALAPTASPSEPGGSRSEARSNSSKPTRSQEDQDDAGLRGRIDQATGRFELPARPRVGLARDGLGGGRRLATDPLGEMVSSTPDQLIHPCPCSGAPSLLTQKAEDLVDAGHLGEADVGRQALFSNSATDSASRSLSGAGDQVGVGRIVTRTAGDCEASLAVTR